jgi:excisionase family DNA binding protein
VVLTLPLDTQTSLSPPKVAKLLGVTHQKILRWIGDGELTAVNITQQRDGRPRFVVMPADLQAFIESRKTKKSPPAPARRPRKAATDADAGPDYY